MGITERQLNYYRSKSAKAFMEGMKESQQRIDRDYEKRAAEREEKFSRELDRSHKEFECQMKEINKKLSDLGSRFGEMTEYMVMPNLVKKFRKLGFVFTKAYPEAEIKDEVNNILAEVDITLENGDKVMIVEVKTKPNIQDIKDHIERMETVRRHADLHGDTRKFLGAIAAMIFQNNVKAFILKNGFYTIHPSGETFDIVSPDEAKEW